MSTIYRIHQKICIFILLGLPPSINALFAQKIESPTFQTESNFDSTAKRWSGGGSLGLDAAGITLINPRLNEGESRLNAGGLANFWLNYQSKRWIWNNRGNLQLSLTQDGTSPDWTKSADAILLNTQLGLRIRGNWYIALMADVQTQLLRTYDSRFIASKDPNFVPRPLTSKFFSPATVKLAPGFLWKPKSYFSILISAISNKNIIVADNYLASLGDSATHQSLFGNDWSNPNNFSNISSQIGGQLRVDFNKKFADDRLVLTSTLDVYSNYLKTPENLAVEWFTSFDAMLTERFSLCLRSDWYYDHNVLVRIGGDPDNLGRRIFIRNTFLLKYNRNF
ncbi:MAG: hypothetical protein RL757_3378 [Bacteroidota bacterium]|jgi:hypothetical protein